MSAKGRHMKNYIVGWIDNSEELHEFQSEWEADYEAEEWVSIKAASLDEAKKLYDEKFLEWQVRQERLHDENP